MTAFARFDFRPVFAELRQWRAIAGSGMPVYRQNRTAFRVLLPPTDVHADSIRALQHGGSEVQPISSSLVIDVALFMRSSSS